jgi:hypothetical protein
MSLPGEPEHIQALAAERYEHAAIFFVIELRPELDEQWINAYLVESRLFIAPQLQPEGVVATAHESSETIKPDRISGDIKNGLRLCC